MKFSGKMCLKTTLKVTKNQGFSLFLEDTLFEKPQGEGGAQTDSPRSCFRIKKKDLNKACFLNNLFPFIATCKSSTMVLKEL